MVFVLATQESHPLSLAPPFSPNFSSKCRISNLSSDNSYSPFQMEIYFLFAMDYTERCMGKKMKYLVLTRTGWGGGPVWWEGTNHHELPPKTSAIQIELCDLIDLICDLKIRKKDKRNMKANWFVQRLEKVKWKLFFFVFFSIFRCFLCVYLFSDQFQWYWIHSCHTVDL